MRIIEELKRRRVFRVALGYLVVAWLVIQVAGQLIQLLELPTWIGKTVVLVVALGLPIALILAWAYDVTPEGVVRTDSSAGAVPARSLSPSVRRGAWFGLGLLVALVGSWMVVTRARGDAEVDASVVAVAPFRISAADDSYAYLREGMIDLLAAKLTGEGGPRAADPRSVLAAWRDAGIRAEDDLSVEPALAAARSIGAGLLLRGDVVGSPTHITITASLLRVPDGDEIGRASEEGRAEDLPLIVDRLAVELLAQLDETDPERIARLAETSLPALRTYLMAQSAYRAGRFDHALELYRRAVGIDSTFAIGALAWVVAAEWDPAQWPEAIGRAYALRDRLSERDQAVLLSYSGALWPLQPSDAELLRTTELAVTRVTDRADLWAHLGELLIHATPRTRYEDHRDRARAAFDRAVAIDSSFLAAYPHLIEMAALRGDTATVRRLATPYFASDSTEALTVYLKWLVAHTLGEDEGVDSAIAALENIDVVAIARIAGMAQLEAVGLDDAERAIDVLRRRAADPQTRRVIQSFDMNRGRIARAGSMDLGLPAPNDFMAVTDALYGDGDSLRAAQAIERIRARLLERPGATPRERRIQLFARYTLEQWRAWQGETDGIPEAVALLRSPEAAEVMGSGRTQLAAALLEALEAGINERTDAAQKIATLEATADTGRLLDGTYWWDSGMPATVAARLYEMRGDRASALRALRHRYYHFFATDHIAPRLLHEARLAAQTGDREGAIRAYRHYLELRTDPDPALRPQVEQARAELARLVGEPR